MNEESADSMKSPRRILHRLAAAAAAVAIAGSLAACSQSGQSSAVSTQTPSTGSVAIFTPSDGISLSSDVPLNRWNDWTPALEQALEDAGVAKDDITSTSSSSLEKQSQDIQDYVVEHVNDAKDEQYADASTEASAITLVVAPACADGSIAKYYGDYVTQPTSSLNGDDKSSLERLASSLTLAQNAGMHVVLVSGTFEGFEPDAVIQMSTGRRIGALQATQMVKKLALDKASSSNPRHIEIVLPYDSSSDDGAEFAAEAFAGAWGVLQPYFQDGKAISPSGTLTASTTSSQWHEVACDGAKKESIEAEVKERLSPDGSKTPQAIDGIIAMNDFGASAVVSELDKLGYTGSAADINPSITISGIIDSFAGKKDLDKQSVPAPQGAGHSGSLAQGAQSDAWPLVTGYGAYVGNMPDIVDAKQWMTGLEDRDAIAQGTARICIALNQQQTLEGIESVEETAVNGTKTKTLEVPLLAVNASNLRETLIDPGYITLADAGL